MLKLVDQTFEDFLEIHKMKAEKKQNCKYCNCVLDELLFYETKDSAIIEYKGNHDLEKCVEGACFIVYKPKDQTNLKDAFDSIT